MESLPRRLIRRTPWVALPITRNSSTAKRMAMPDLLMIIKSFSSVTFKMEMSSPVFSVICRVFTPLPPRLVTR